MNLWHKVNTKMEHEISRLISSGFINFRNNLLLKFKRVYSKVLVSSVNLKEIFQFSVSTVYHKRFRSHNYVLQWPEPA